MAEYKNGVNFRGNMSVEADDISPEVKTGRVVFVDEDLYESNEEYKAKVDKCVEEGFMRSDEAGSGGGSGGGLEICVVKINPQYSQEIIADKTFAEVEAAWKAGELIMFFTPAVPDGNAGRYAIAYPAFSDDYTDPDSFSKPISFTATFITGGTENTLEGARAIYEKSGNITIGSFTVS